MTSKEDLAAQAAPRKPRATAKKKTVTSVKDAFQNQQSKDLLKRLSVDIDGELLFRFRQITLSQRTTIREEVTKFVEDYVDKYDSQ